MSPISRGFHPRLLIIELVDYQLEVDKGILTAVANFSNSLRRLIYLYQLQVDNQLVV